VDDQDTPLAGFGAEPLGVEEGPLGFLGGETRAEQLRVDADEPPTTEVDHPAVGAEVIDPTPDAVGADDLVGLNHCGRGVAQIVVPGNGAPRCVHTAHLFARVGEVLLVVGAVHGSVAQVQDQVRPRDVDVFDHGRPVALCRSNPWGQMAVRHDDHPERAHEPRLGPV
jgi:hypothetical protein